MIKEEAIKILSECPNKIHCVHYNNVYNCNGCKLYEALEIATKYLQADMVSRTQYQGLLNAIGKVYVEVVRCKDCKHWTEEKDEEDDILYGWCRAPFENDNMLVYGDDATRILTAYDFFCKSGGGRESCD